MARPAGPGARRCGPLSSPHPYLASIDDWAAFNEIYRDTFRPPYPARTTVGAELHGVLVEVSVVAVLAGKEIP